MKWKEFLNPRSMLTPGVAGSMVMVIANTLWIEFMVPQKWTALVLSFLLLIPILLRFSATIFEKFIYFTFNGLIVFALAVNTNFAGRQLQQIAGGEKQMVTMQENPYKPLIASAFKEKNNNIYMDDHIQLSANTVTTTVTTATTQRKTEDKDTDQTNAEKNDKNKDQKKDKNKREFFEQWF